MKTLHLSLKKELFNKIKSGEKKIEYREAKPYWIKRLFTSIDHHFFKEYDKIIFKNGYGKNSPTIEKTFLCSEYLKDGSCTDLKTKDPVIVIYFK